MYILLDAIEGTGDLIGEIWTFIVETASSIISYVLILLPRSPFADIQYAVPENFNKIMHMFFWLFPAHQIIVHYASIVGLFVIYYSLRIAMNWVKMIGS